MPGPSLGGNIGGPSINPGDTVGGGGGDGGPTTNFSSIKNLPEIADIQSPDFLLVETPTETSKIQFGNFFIGKQNITFAGELTGLDNRLSNLNTQTDNLTGLIQGGTGTFYVGGLDSTGPLTARDGIKIGADTSYIKNVGGFYSFSAPVSSSINFHTSGGNSNQWSTTYSSVYSNSANWNKTHTSVNNYSGSWDSTNTDVFSNSSTWSNTYATVLASSASWGGGSSKWTDGGDVTYLTSTSDLVAIGSDKAGQKLTVKGSISASNVIFSSGGDSTLWENTYTTVKANSSSWGSGGGGSSFDATELQSNSANWNYTATNSAVNVAFDVTNNGSSAYRFNNGGFANDDNPTIHLIKGQSYKFRVNASGHPFYLKTTPGTGTGNQYTDGVTNNGAAQGNVDFVVPQDAPDIIYYQCSVHSGMNGKIYLGDMVDYANSYTTTNSNSSKWEQTYSTVNANSGTWSTSVSGGIALVGTTVHLADPETLTQIAEADAVAADRMLIWDESASTWKYITVEDLQDEIDTGGGSGEANEYSFKTVTLSSRDTTIPHQSDIIADTTTDTLTLCAGPNIELIGDSTTDTITISARDVQGGSGSGAAERIYKEITQSNSFSVGNAVYIKSDGDYDKAKANDESTADVVGIITAATGSNFTVTYNGEATVSSHGFTVGAGLFLSSGTAGALTETSPTGTDISKPVGVVKDANTIIVATYRGLIGSGAGAGGGGGHTIQYDGSGLTSRTNLNFVSTGGVTDPLVADDSGNDASKVTMPNGFDIMMISEVFR